MSNGWLIIFLIPIVAILMDGVVKIIKAAKAKSPGGDIQQIKSLEQTLSDLVRDLNDARSRIEVLEKIVIDDKFQLARDIDDLAREA